MKISASVRAVKISGDSGSLLSASITQGHGRGPRCRYLPATPPADDYVDEDATSSLHLAPIKLNTEPMVAVIGVGYVGLQLIACFSTRFQVLGFDISKERIGFVQEEFGHNRSVRCTNDASELKDATHFLIAVPTLLLPDKRIDSSALREAIKTVAMYARPGATVVVESSVAVGMTRQLLGPVAASRGLFAGMSPERVDPGRTEPPIQSIPKVVSGLDDIVPGSLENISRLYSAVFDTVIPVSKPEIAEMTKLYENCQRMICIAYANEMADACIAHGIDSFEVCAAAATKPFGYLPFTPGLGVGGHCIPINPYYLLSNNSFPLLQAATERMRERPSIIAQRVLDSISVSKEGYYKTINQRPRVLVVGVGFKAGQATLSNSPGLELIKSLSQSGRVDVSFADRLVEQSMLPQIARLADGDWNRACLEQYDTIVVAMRQDGMDIELLREVRGVRIEMWCTYPIEH
ncbi:polysaccharide biosynthesis protein vipA/tviB [Hyaloscypha finlandica]|nr:polysaccharide biosynthesis protein vipA/tviB [Hyaloscypha finlandica]